MGILSPQNSRVLNTNIVYRLLVIYTNGFLNFLELTESVLYGVTPFCFSLTLNNYNSQPMFMNLFILLIKFSLFHHTDLDYSLLPCYSTICRDKNVVRPYIFGLDWHFAQFLKASLIKISKVPINLSCASAAIF